MGWHPCQAPTSPPAANRRSVWTGFGAAPLQVGSGQRDKTGGGKSLDRSTSPTSKGAVSDTLFKSTRIYHSGTITHLKSRCYSTRGAQLFRCGDPDSNMWHLLLGQINLDSLSPLPLHLCVTGNQFTNQFKSWISSIHPTVPSWWTLILFPYFIARDKRLELQVDSSHRWKQMLF